MTTTTALTACHQAPYWGTPRRCTACGHRRPAEDGTPPVQTRELPVWTWPAELVNRLRARWAGRNKR